MSFMAKRTYPNQSELNCIAESRRELRTRDGLDTSKHRTVREGPATSALHSKHHHRPHTGSSVRAPSYHRTPPVYFKAPPTNFWNHMATVVTTSTSSMTSSATNMGRSDSYVTPSLYELLQLLQTRGGYPNQQDQILKDLYLGDEHAATNKVNVQHLGITHILNAADGIHNVNTGAYYYKDLPITYYGVEAYDDASFNMYPHFYPAARFINHGLKTHRGKVLVHCAMGISRAATLVLAFLMIYKNLTLVDAIQTVIAKRPIYPNKGFLYQLRDLDIKLSQERSRDSSPEP